MSGLASRLAWTVAAVVLAGAASAQRGPAAEPRAVTPRGPLLAEEQHVIKLFETTAPSVAYITTQTIARRGFFTAEVKKPRRAIVWVVM